MFLRSFLTLFFFFFSLIFASLLLSQMPDWIFFQDRDGNKYYYNNAFKIVITDEPDFDFPPVSERGIEYYYNSAMEYVKKGDVSKGLFFYKSILAIRSENNRVKKFQVNAADQIRGLLLRHGTRMDDYDNRSTLLITKNQNLYNVINEKLYYNLDLQHRPWIIKEGWKNSQKGYGLQFGINRDGTNKKTYDFIVGVETKILPNALQTAEEAEEIWEKLLGSDAFSRELFYKSREICLYTYKYPGDSPFQGYEGVFINKKMMHLVRVIYHNKMEPALGEEVKKMMESIVFVK